MPATPDDSRRPGRAGASGAAPGAGPDAAIDIDAAVASIAADHQSSASELLERTLDVLVAATRDGAGRLHQAGAALCRAQPTMASIWTAVGVAWSAGATGDAEATLAALHRFGERTRRAPATIARAFVEYVTLDASPAGALRLVTCSGSRTALACLRALAKSREVHVACAEGRPALEGRLLASRLASLELPVDLYTDGAVGVALDGATAVLLGADTVAPGWVVNKCGSRALAATAASQGVPVIVAAGADKLLPAALADLLPLAEGPAEAVWADPPGGVSVRNPSFERIPLDLTTAVVSDVGTLTGEMVRGACEGRASGLAMDRLLPLVRDG